jgi:hypothetical protein
LGFRTCPGLTWYCLRWSKFLGTGEGAWLMRADIPLALPFRQSGAWLRYGRHSPFTPPFTV